MNTVIAELITVINHHTSVSSRLHADGTCYQLTAVLCCAEIESKNHVKENMRRIRQIQRNTHQNDDETQQQQPVKALWKLSRFDSVPSRVKQQLQVEHVAC